MPNFADWLDKRSEEENAPFFEVTGSYGAPLWIHLGKVTVSSANLRKIVDFL